MAPLSSDIPNKKLLRKQTGVVALLAFVLAALSSAGGLIAYSESKFASKESTSFQSQRLDTEIRERQIDRNDLKEDIRGLGVKVDEIWKAVVRK